MRMLYLYTEIMGYQMPILGELINRYSAEVHVIHWDYNKLTTYIPPEMAGVTFHKRSTFAKDSLVKFVENLNPDLAYISGWQDRGYLPAAKLLRKKRKPVVVGFDDLWKGTIRQYIGSAFIRLYLKRRCFSHAWVSGPYQFEYARRFGFAKDEIIFNLLSCDADKFGAAAENLGNKLQQYPRRFLYVGNFRSIKGTDILVQAYELYKSKYDGDWSLLCVGNGPLENLLNASSGIEVKGFSTSDELAELTKVAGAFILPSRLDQWGVAAHEFAVAGLPLILSENVGSHPVFLINGYNGYKYRSNSPDNLARTMKSVSSMAAQDLVTMGHRSHNLASCITPRISAASLVSVLYS